MLNHCYKTQTSLLNFCFFCYYEYQLHICQLPRGVPVCHLTAPHPWTKRWTSMILVEPGIETRHPRLPLYFILLVQLSNSRLVILLSSSTEADPSAFNEVKSRDENSLWALLHLDEVLTVSHCSDLGRKVISIISSKSFSWIVRFASIPLRDYSLNRLFWMKACPASRDKDVLSLRSLYLAR